MAGHCYGCAPFVALDLATLLAPNVTPTTNPVRCRGSASGGGGARVAAVFYALHLMSERRLATLQVGPSFAMACRRSLRNHEE